MSGNQDSFDFSKNSEESGYQKWQARLEAEKKNEVETRSIQGGLDFENENADESGFERWQESNEARRKEIEVKYGLILGRKVRLKLRQLDKEIEGVIHFRGINKKVMLSIETFEFEPDDIESMVCV